MTRDVFTSPIHEESVQKSLIAAVERRVLLAGEGDQLSNSSSIERSTKTSASKKTHFAYLSNNQQFSFVKVTPNSSRAKRRRCSPSFEFSSSMRTTSSNVDSKARRRRSARFFEIITTSDRRVPTSRSDRRRTSAPNA